MNRRKQEKGTTQPSGSQIRVPSGPQLPGGVITALFTDIVGSTQLKGLMPGETSARRDTAYRRDIKEPHDAIVLVLLSKHGGQVVNPTGDGFCAVFPDAEEAVLCAVEIQEQIVARAIPTPLGKPLQLCVGLHTGFAMPSGDDIIASTIDYAARVQGKAEGEQVLVSRETHAIARDKIHGISFDAAGVFDLKGLGREELFIAFRAGQNPLADIDDKYRQHIVERFGKLTLYSVTSDKPLAVDLEQVFVKLMTTAQKRIYLTVKEESLQFLDDIQARKEPGVRFELYNRQPQVVTLALNEPLREHTHLAILGAPGSGKTTLLKYLTLSFARRQTKHRLELDEDRLPLYLALRDLNKWLDAQEKQWGLPPQLPPALLPRFLTESYAQLFPSLNLPSDFFSRALVQKKCAVLLDGLDEIADSLKRVRAAEFVAACLGHYAGNRFVLTSRPRGYETACRQQLSSACGECTIRDLDDEQIRRFAESWYLAVTIDRAGDHPTARDHAKQSAEDLLGAVQTVRVRPLATNPLLLSILALIHQRGSRLPPTPRRAVRGVHRVPARLLASGQRRRGRARTRGNWRAVAERETLLAGTGGAVAAPTRRERRGSLASRTDGTIGPAIPRTVRPQRGGSQAARAGLCGHHRSARRTARRTGDGRFRVCPPHVSGIPRRPRAGGYGELLEHVAPPLA